MIVGMFVQVDLSCEVEIALRFMLLYFGRCGCGRKR
jgi:hypothetical protein